jgi:pimeloyl-ACP methyl ester carboxylesterase
MAEIQTDEYVVEGLRCFVRASGPQHEHEAVVFVHGNPGSSEDWLDLLSHAGDIGRAIAPDMPAFGKAERPRDFDYTVEGYAHYLDALLCVLGIDRVHLVLHDFGGPWGLCWAIEHPTRVASLTLLNVGLTRDYTWHLVARLWRTPIIGEMLQAFSNRAAFKRVLNASNPKPLPEAFLDRMYDDTDAGLKRAQLALYRATPDFKALSDSAAAKLGPLGLPALVIWGEADKYVPVRFAGLQSQYFRAEIHTLPNAGHWPMVDEPEQVRAWVIPFLQKQLSARAKLSANAVR